MLDDHVEKMDPPFAQALGGYTYYLHKQAITRRGLGIAPATVLQIYRESGRLPDCDRRRMERIENFRNGNKKKARR